MRKSDGEPLLGLKAWEQQKRNRRRRALQALGFLCLLATGIGWSLPEDANPFVVAGLLEPQRRIRLAQAEAIAAAIHTRETSRQATNAPTPQHLTTAIDPLPPAPFPAADMTCLARAVYSDARGDNLAGQIGVAQVLMNRHREAGGATLCQVVDTAVAQGLLCRSALGCPTAKSLPSASNRFWMQAQWIAEEVAAGRAHLRELEHAYRYHYYLAQPAWRLTQRPVRRLGQNVFYVSVTVEPDMTYGSSRRPWDEPGTFEMIGEEQSLSAGQLVTTSAPVPAPARKLQPVALPSAKPAPTFNPFATSGDQR